MKKSKIVFYHVVAIVLLFAIGLSLGVGVYKGLHPVEFVSTEVNGIHTDLQEQYLDGRYQNIGLYARGKAELSIPDPIVLSWEDYGESKYIIYVSENADMQDANVYVSADATVSIYNLKIGTDYYWMVENNEGEVLVSNKIFTTDDTAPRNMYVDGVTNVRDLGGWDLIGGGKVKQGLIYRCGRLNENKTPMVVQKITDKGIATMVDEMGIKSEIDLRLSDNNEIGSLTGSVLGEDVNYYNCAMGYNYNMLTTNTEPVREVFKLLADESNYPLIFHCSIGTDRTGMIAFMVNALLGVAEDDLYRDYLFSNFGEIGGDRSKRVIAFNYVFTIKHTKGDSLKQKTENYLLSIGVTQQEIDSIRDILTEK